MTPSNPTLANPKQIPQLSSSKITVMEQARLYNFLQKLQDFEWLAFEAYLLDPTAGASELYTRFLKAFKYMHDNSTTLSAEDFFQAVYPSKKYIPKKANLHMNRHLTQMQAKLFDFLGLLEFQKNKELQEAARIGALAARGWTEAHNREVQKAVKNLAIQPITDGKRYLQVLGFQLGTAYLEHTEPTQIHLQPVIQALDRAYSITALELACRARNADLFEGTTHQDPQWLTHDPEFAKQLAGDAQLATMLFDIYQMYQQREHGEPSFDKALRTMKHLSSGSIRSNTPILENLFSHLIQHAGRYMQHNPAKYRLAIVEIYTWMFDHDVLLVDGQLHPAHFLNLTFRCIQAKTVNSLPDFLQKHKTKLPATVQEATTNLCLAQILFDKKEYEAARNQLGGNTEALGNPEYFEVALSYRVYELAITISCKLLEQGERVSATFQTWLHRHKSTFPKERLAAYRAFAQSATKITKWLLLLESVGPQPDWSKEINRLKESWKTQPPVFQSWLLDMLKHLPK
jgi:hypothetical protein